MTAGSASRSPRRSPRQAPRSASAPGRRRSASFEPCSSAASSTSRCSCRRQQARLREDLSARRRLRRPLAKPPTRCATNKRYRDVGDFTIDGLAARLLADFGEQAARHRRALARQRPRGQEAAARDHAQRATSRPSRVSAYSMVSLVQPPRAAHARRRLVPLALVHGQRARRSPATAAACRRRRRRSRATRACSRSRRAASRASASTSSRPARSPRAPRARSASSTR